MKHHSLLVYGESTVGKTSFLALLVRELLQRFPGKRARLCTAEHSNAMQDLLDEGLVEVWKLNTRSYPFQCARRATDGYWPVDAADPESKLVMLPTYWEKYPIRIFEGGTTISNYIAGSSVTGAFAERIGVGQQIGPSDSKDGPVCFMDGEEGVGALSRSNFGFVQREMTSIIQRSQKHPGYSIWTSHQDDVKEKKAGMATGRTLIGPEIFGGALTASIGREFADFWHLVRVTADDGTVERRLYLRDHVEENAIALARNSVPLPLQAKVPDYIRLSEKGGLPRLEAAKILLEKLPTF